MKLSRNIITYLSLIIIFISCETDVTNEITLVTGPSKLIIEGGLERNSISPLTTQSIKLTTTNNFLSDIPNPVVINATVSITDGANIWDFNHQGEGVYSNSDITLQLGFTYTITIIWEGDTYIGIDTLNEVPQFEDFYVKFEEETSFSPEGYFLRYDSTDPPGIVNYYYNRIFKNDEPLILPDPGNRFNLITSDEFFDGQQRININVNDEISFKVGEKGTGQQLGISKEYFDYLFELFTQTGSSGSAFSGNPPPATIRSNMINTTVPSKRALGFFYAADVAEGTLIVTEE
ncbi:DUF4249 domain-containing protein [Tenacibaculum agarivorans]|uniref:DUF4249 domain-containing protein n=1 Tax=Tenacibaculum agarivorans TaxID=1908389 RepID=UPI00094B878B|nr:DUF4249 domain-containing protein [Tenacibaculum agarivorans]